MRSPTSRLRSRAGRRLPSARLPEVLHGRNPRLADRLAARRLGCPHHERRRARRDRSARPPARAGRSRSTRSVTGPTARRSTHSRRRARSGSRSGSATGSSTANGSRRRTSGASPPLGVACSVQFSHAPSDRDLADRLLGRRDRRRLRLPFALGLRRARRQRLRRACRGARPARRHPCRRPADDRRPRRRGTPSRR